MNTVKVQCPAKINLSLKVLGKRPDGFHDIESIMQTVSLYDYLTINIESSSENEIILSGNSTDIPYDRKNLVYKAIELYLKESNLTGLKISVNIEKNIPVSAGMAGGSTDGAGILLGLNHLFDKFNDKELHKLCALLGSDLNVCLKGGKILAKGRGEILEDLPFENFNLSVIKPKRLGISAKEAYTKFSYKISNKVDIQTRRNYTNDLEWAVIDDYEELKYIKSKYPKSIMTGSGSAYYIIDSFFNDEPPYEIINNLQAIPYGVKII